jgi:2-oxoglutarate dehydrogenase E2 component (dihydrolipoamide succinyltransferase)
MAVEIRVPTLGESVVEAEVGTWLKHEGDTVQRGDALVELETDKVNVEVPAEQEGVLQKIIKHEGETVSVGDVLGLIGEGAGVASPQKKTEAEATPGSRAPQAAASPGVGAAPQQGTEYRPTPTSGTPLPTETQPAQATGDGQRSPSPLARRIAAEHNIDLSQIKVQSPHGRVTKDDVISYLEQQSQRAAAPAQSVQSVQPVQPVQSVQSVQSVPSEAPSAPPPPPTQAPAPAPVVSAPAPTPEKREERIRLSRRRQTIAQRLVDTQHAAAMLTTFNEIDMSAVMDMRSRRKESFKERYNVSLGFMSFFTKAVVAALKAFPRLNAEIQGNEMILKYYYDIGIAVGAEEGLVVPVVRDADKKSFAEIEREIADLAKRARDNTLTLADLQGGTFTITNGGVFGSLLSTPILNGPQVGILGMHKIEQRPVVVNGQIVIRPMMYVALSYDHRLVDGREAVQFLVRVKELLEDPAALLLEG